MMTQPAKAGDAARAADDRVAEPNEMRVVTPDGQFIAPRVGETIPGAAVRDAAGKCQFSVTSFGPELLLDGDKCTVTVHKKGKPEKSLLRNPPVIEKTSPRMGESVPWKAPDQSELFGAPTSNKQRSGTSNGIDPSVLSTPGPQSKAGEARAYTVTCPKIQVRLLGWMTVSRYMGLDIFNRPYYRQIAKIGPRARFYRSLNNGGLGSIRPYWYPSDWAYWRIINQEMTHFTFRGFRALGPLTDGPSQIRIQAVGYFASSVGRRENLEISGQVYTYRDMVVYHECSAHGALVGVNRLRCRGYGRYVRPAEC
ncbi:MAG: hypothetical protein AAB783_01670 [Patescibacteria group bacterium]